jgi:hypothetical protein
MPNCNRRLPTEATIAARPAASTALVQQQDGCLRLALPILNQLGLSPTRMVDASSSSSENGARVGGSIPLAPAMRLVWRRTCEADAAGSPVKRLALLAVPYT